MKVAINIIPFLLAKIEFMLLDFTTTQSSQHLHYDTTDPTIPTTT